MGTVRSAPSKIFVSELYSLFRPKYCQLRPYLRSTDLQEADPSPYGEVIRRLGIRHEKSHLGSLEPAVNLSDGTTDERLHRTREALEARTPVVYHGLLCATAQMRGRKRQVVGEPDFMIRTEQGYVIRDSKISRRISEEDHPEILRQLETYAWLYEKTAGHPPAALEVHSGANDIVRIPYDDGGRRARQALAQLVASREFDEEPYSPVGWSKCAGCGYKGHCWGRAEENNDVAMVDGVDLALAEQLHTDAVRTIGELIERFDEESLREYRRRQGERMRRVGQKAERILTMANVMLSRQELILERPALPQGDNFVMFDLEGLPPQLDELDKIFLWGIQVFGQDAGEYFAATAGPGSGGDRKAWFEFLELADTVFQEYGDIPFVHWHNYEATKVRAYVGRYGDPRGVAERVLENLVDLLPITRDSIALPLPSYSLKEVEKYVGYARTQSEYGGDWAMAQYIEATEMEDEEARSAVMDEILTYNREDLEATWAVFEWLREKAEAAPTGSGQHEPQAPNPGEADGYGSISVEIRFGKSSSQNYRKAIIRARRFPSFAPLSDDQSFNSVLFGPDEFRARYREFESLLELVQYWKSTEILIGGKAVDAGELRQYTMVFHCSQEYKRSVLPEEHCEPHEGKGWGCKHLDTIRCDLPESSWDLDRYKYWFQFGRFKTENEWVIDKTRIRETLEREARLKRLQVCDVFQMAVAEQVLEKLPDAIDLRDNEKWTVVFEENDMGSAVERKPLSIAPKFKDDDRWRPGGLSISIGADDDEGAEKEAPARLRNIPEVRFDDIGGIDEIVQVVREVIELPLRQPDVFSHLGITPHRGVLLYGDPGCGKTLIAKAIANEIGAHFIPIKGPELLSKWHGQSEENLRSIFEEAREFQPSIVYFDEIDSIAQLRSGEESLRFDARLVNQLLTLMDGIEGFGNVCVIASTNREELIDPALLRPGRFDYSLHVKKPTREGCVKIFEIHTRAMPITSGVDKRLFAEKLLGLSGAEIAYVAREAAYNCLRRNVDFNIVFSEDESAQIDPNNLVVSKLDLEGALHEIRERNSD